MVVASVIVQLDLSNELDLDSIMFNFSGFSVESHIHLDEEMHNNHEIEQWTEITSPTFPVTLSPS